MRVRETGGESAAGKHERIFLADRSDFAVHAGAGFICALVSDFKLGCSAINGHPLNERRSRIIDLRKMAATKSKRLQALASKIIQMISNFNLEYIILPIQLYD